MSEQHSVVKDSLTPDPARYAVVACLVDDTFESGEAWNRLDYTLGLTYAGANFLDAAAELLTGMARERQQQEQIARLTMEMAATSEAAAKLADELGTRIGELKVEARQAKAEIASLKAERDSANRREQAWRDRFGVIVGADEPDSAGNEVITLKAERDRMADKAEQLRVQLAGCSVAAMGNTRKTIAENSALAPGAYGDSVAYRDVIDAATRECNERERADRLAAEVDRLTIECAITNKYYGETREREARLLALCERASTRLKVELDFYPHHAECNCPTCQWQRDFAREKGK